MTQILLSCGDHRGKAEKLSKAKPIAIDKELLS